MFNIHNDNERLLLKCLYNECSLYIQSDCDSLIDRIDGMTCSLYMLDIIEKPLIISNYYDVLELMESIRIYLNRKGEKNYERSWWPCTNW